MPQLPQNNFHVPDKGQINEQDKQKTERISRQHGHQ